jgi:hypothetical protein
MPKLKMFAPFVCLLILGLSACGSSSSGTGPYYNMNTLAKGFEETFAEKYPAFAAGTKITCIKTGKQTAECHAADENGQEASVEVSIAENGKSFISH